MSWFLEFSLFTRYPVSLNGELLNSPQLHFTFYFQLFPFCFLQHYSLPRQRPFFFLESLLHCKHFQSSPAAFLCRSSSRKKKKRNKKKYSSSFDFLCLLGADGCLYFTHKSRCQSLTGRLSRQNGLQL